MNPTYPLLIDGGLSNQLEDQGIDLNHKLWSAKLLDSEPEAIVDAHLAYLEAGARCITSASYQATIPGFLSIGYDIIKAESLIIKSIRLAEIAINRFKINDYTPLIAASIGPYGAYLADGSEYDGNYKVSDKTLREFHEHRIDILNQSNADILACETIPSFQEAKVLERMLVDAKKPAWVSFSCKDDNHINDGTTIGKCVELFSNNQNVFAVGVNCTAPKHISGLIKHLKVKSGNKKIIIYPNSGAIYQSQSKTWQGISGSRCLEKIW